MAYATVPTVATGDSWSAAQHNTYIKNNFAALWPYTTAGDMAYATSSSTLTRIPIGTENQMMQISGGVPTWGAAPSSKSALISRVATQSITNSTYTKITFDTETYDNNSFWTAGDPTKIGFVTAGYYRIDGKALFSNNNNNNRVVVFSKTTPTSGAAAAHETINTVNAVMPFTYFYSATANDYLYYWAYQNSGSSLTFTGQLYISYIGT